MQIEIKANASGDLYLEDETGRITRLYRFREALALAHISALTYYTWVKRGLFADVRLRDRGKWRVFTEQELKALIHLTNRMAETPNSWHPPPQENRSRPSDGRSFTWRDTS